MLPIVADHHILDVTAPIDQGANLSSGFMRQFGHLPGEFRSHDLMRRIRRV